MKVSRVGGPKDAQPTKKTSRAPAAGEATFADSLRETQGPATAEPVEQSAVAGVDGILAAQAVADPTDDRPQRRRLMEFGDDLLDRLDELRVGILTGTIPKEQLADLAQKLRQKREASADPVLNEIIQEIELRAEVEIAKYSRKV